MISDDLKIDTDHVYRLAGKRIPGVNELLVDVGLRPLLPPLQHIVEGQERGKTVHNILHLLDEGIDVEYADEHSGFIDGYRKFKMECGFSPVLSEQMAYHRQLLFACTIDRVGYLGNDVMIVDFKTSKNSSAVDDWMRLQLAGNQLAYTDDDRKPENIKRAILKLFENGKYRFILCDGNEDIMDFLAAVRVYYRKRR